MSAGIDVLPLHRSRGLVVVVGGCPPLTVVCGVQASKGRDFGRVQAVKDAARLAGQNVIGCMVGRAAKTFANRVGIGANRVRRQEDGQAVGLMRPKFIITLDFGEVLQLDPVGLRGSAGRYAACHAFTFHPVADVALTIQHRYFGTVSVSTTRSST